MRKKVPPEGSIFLVPLRDSGFATGVLARLSGDGLCFGYFFGPRVQSEDDINFEILDPERAILVGQFGDLEFLRGNWKIVGQVDNWLSSRWPIVPLARIDERAGWAWLSTYDDKVGFVQEVEISVGEARTYHNDGLMGAGAVEIRLTKLLDKS